jgi:ATP-binding cassette subfamily B protein
VEKLPNGFGTQIENGTMLSGGQNNVLPFARALYKNPEVLLIRTTSSLDQCGKYRKKSN